jgi:hypothetical protein
MDNLEKLATLGTQDTRHRQTTTKTKKNPTQYVLAPPAHISVNKGNNKITELRTILQRESQNS